MREPVASKNRFAWVAAIAVMAATALFCLTQLCWPVREQLPALSANSEFFAFSWIYGLRWSAGEAVFLPHSQLLLPVYALINRIFNMSQGGTVDIIAGWHRIAMTWPLVMSATSLALLFATIDRAAPLFDAVISCALFVISVPLFLTDFALGSMSYHSLGVPLALASLPLWRAFSSEAALRHSVWLGIYAAACLLGKPTFGAFAAPLFVMTFARAVRTRAFTALVVSIAVTIAVYLGGLLAFYGNRAGVAEHFAKSLYFMQSQAGWYDSEKGATPFHWYAGYVIGKMGWLPSFLIAIALAAPILRCDRGIILAGAATAIACALFCLYHRSQIHAHPEFIGLLLATAIASIRSSGWPAYLEARLGHPAAPLAAVAAALMLMVRVAISPPPIEHGFERIMAGFDLTTVPAIFVQPPDVRTVSLIAGDRLMWGVADAWCRGEGDIFDARRRSKLLDRLFGNVTCLVDHENAGSDLSSFNRAVFLRDIKVDQGLVPDAIANAFPDLAKRLSGCAKQGSPLNDTYDLMACRLSPLPTRSAAAEQR